MAFASTVGTTFQPPSYNEEIGRIGEVSVDENLTFVDFWPDCCKPGGLFKQPTYESFQNLIDHGNGWLRNHPRWEVRTCESVELKLTGREFNTQKMTYYESQEMGNWFIRGLRLWIVPSSKDTSQQIGYINLVPERLDKQGLFSMPSYESLEAVLGKFNTMIRTNPIPGKIINVETQEMKTDLRAFDPDRSNWVESGEMANRFLFILRVFFEFSASIVEPIGVMDFIPQILTLGGVFSLPQYETFSNVINKAAIWCNQQTAIRVCNAQTLEIKFQRRGEINTQKMNYFESGMKAYIRILRVVFVQGQNYEGENSKSLINKLTCKTFVPVQLTSGFLLSEFETLDQTKKRMEDWIKLTGAQVISAQTAAARVRQRGATQGIEASCTYSSAQMNSYWIFVICLYLNGFYHEPPAELMPPIPEIQEQKCCVLI